MQCRISIKSLRKDIKLEEMVATSKILIQVI